MKKILNACSYILNVCFIAYFLISMKDCSGLINLLSDSENKASIEDCILEREKADIPLHIQKFDHVNKIVIDSFVFTNDVEPYSGYLVTSWNIDEKVELNINEWEKNNYKDKYVNKDKVVYVEISKITKSGGTVSWESNWTSSYVDVVLLNK